MIPFLKIEVDHDIPAVLKYLLLDFVLHVQFLEVVGTVMVIAIELHDYLVVDQEVYFVQSNKYIVLKDIP